MGGGFLELGRLIGEQAPLAGFFAPDGEEAQRELDALSAGFGHETGATVHGDGPGGDGLQVDVMGFEREITNPVSTDGGKELRLGLNAAVGMRVVEVLGQKWAEGGGVAGEDRGDAGLVGPLDGREVVGGGGAQGRQRHEREQWKKREKKGPHAAMAANLLRGGWNGNPRVMGEGGGVRAGAARLFTALGDL